MTQRDRGFVLVNALIIVAAMAAAAVFLAARAEDARTRRASMQETYQLRLYLDAFEAFSIRLLDQDLAEGDTDHSGEAWARADLDVPLDRGRVLGGLRDLQAGFNINWLADPSNTRAAEGFARLAATLGVPASAAEAIAAHVAPDGPGARTGYAAQNPALAPVGGAAVMAVQLTEIPGLSERNLRRLAPFISVIPAGAGLNVNAAPKPVLAAFLPELSAAQLDRVLAARARAPFGSLEAFFADTGAAFDADTRAALETGQLQVGSNWFASQARAVLGSREGARLTIYQRLGLPQGTRVAYRLRQQ